MASQHIEIPSTASRLSSEVRSAIDRLEALQSDWSEIKAIMDQVAYEGDYTTLGTYLGLDATDAEAVYNLWGSANTELHATFLTQVQARLG